MFLLYVDESGTGLGDKRTPFFLLSCISFRAADWLHIDNNVLELKQQLVNWAKPEDFEIKGRDIRRGEKFFATMNWESRANAIRDVSKLIADIPCQIIAVQVDKRLLTEYIRSDEQLYRLAFSRLLEEVDRELNLYNQPGMLLIDTRSDLHSSVQDRRLIDVYREWRSSHQKSNLVEIPWFGFSAFYAGLQLADFSAYMIDFMANELGSSSENHVMRGAFQLFEKKVRRVLIP
jgi:hypothetical protein